MNETIQVRVIRLFRDLSYDEREDLLEELREVHDNADDGIEVEVIDDEE